jgi:hypothetical protein
MRKWLLSVVLLLGFVSSSRAEPFLIGGPITTPPGQGHIVVGETTVSVSPSTSITDEQGRTVDPGELKFGQWVSVEAEPDGESGMEAKKIVLLQRKASKEDRDRRFARVLIVLWLLAAQRHPG